MPKAVLTYRRNPRLARAAARCRDAEKAVNRLCELYDDLPDHLMAPLSDRQHAARDIAIQIPARTIADVVAKASIAVCVEDVDTLSKEVMLDLLWLHGIRIEVRL